MCWFKVAAFWWSGVAIKTFFAGAALETILWWVSGIDITSRDLVALGTGKGERLGVNSSGVRSDNEGFAGHGRKRDIYLVPSLVLSLRKYLVHAIWLRKFREYTR